MSFLKKIICSIALIALASLEAQAQMIILKDNQRINASDFTVADGKISRTIKLSNGKDGQATLSLTDIDRMDWPNVKQVQEAELLRSQGKVKEAVEILVKALDFFKPFRNIKGSPYADVAFAHIESLDQAGDFDTLIRVLPDVELMKWNEAKKLKLGIIKLNMERRTSQDQEAVLAKAESLLRDTDDSDISARLWLTIGEVHSKKNRWEEALMAYLHVSVFYGSQATLVPQAELNAARSLVKMERFQDAVVMYQRISDTYKGSGTAETAKKEMTVINTQKNKPDDVPQAAKPKDAKDAKEAKDTPKDKDSAKKPEIK